MSKPSPHRDKSLHLTAHRGLDGLHVLREDWLRLTETDHRYWMSFGWHDAYLRHSFCDANTIVYYALRDGHERVQAILPMEPAVAFVRRIPISCLQVIGSLGNDITFLASGSDFPAESPPAAATALLQLISELRRQPDPPSLLLIGRSAAESTALQAATLLGIPAHAKVAVGSWRWLDVSQSFEKILATLSGKFRISLRSTLRNLAAKGAITVGCTPNGDLSFESDYREFLTVESSGWKGDSGTRSGLLVNPTTNQRRFLETLASGMEGFFAEIHWLRLDGRMIAAQLWFRYRDVRIACKIGYLEEFAKYQPGHLLLEHIIQKSCADPTLNTIDFISGFAWLDKWRCAATPHQHCYLPIRPLLGRLSIMLLRLPTLDELRADIIRLRTGVTGKHRHRRR